MAENGCELLIMEADGVGRGFINLSGLRRGGVAEWGFFVAPGAPRGTGMRMGEATLGHVLNEQGAHKLCGEAISNNDRSEERREGKECVRTCSYRGSPYH